MKAYQVYSNKNDTLPLEIANDIYDEEMETTNKKKAVDFVKNQTKRINDKYDTNYSTSDLFDICDDLRYCKKCDCFYWSDDSCDC